MSDAEVHLLTMPKWGLAMTKGQVVGWLIEEGADVRPGLELVRLQRDLAANRLREAAAMTTQIDGELIPSDVPGSLAMAVRQPWASCSASRRGMRR